MLSHAARWPAIYLHSKRPASSRGGPCRLVASAGASPEPAQPVSWDPEGLLGSLPAGGHFARRERERAVAQPAVPARPPPGGPPLRPLPPGAGPPTDGVAASNTRAYKSKDFRRMLSTTYMDVDLSYPGLHILHLDPPVLAVDDFFSAEECDRMVGAALASGRMAGSKVGAGNVTDATLAASSSRRTSTSMMLDDDARAAHPVLSAAAADLHSRAARLLGGGAGAAPWGRPGKLPLPGQYCFEALQVAQYQPGQYFMEHEDGFPADVAMTNGFQRRATLLVYLNDVASGGATRFEHLGLAVQPRRGRALLFFPAFADGRPDDRTLHTAEAAGDTKSVTQQWIACGLGAAPAKVADSGTGIESVLGAKRGKAGKGKKAPSAPSKGFGG